MVRRHGRDGVQYILTSLCKTIAWRKGLQALIHSLSTVMPKLAYKKSRYRRGAEEEASPTSRRASRIARWPENGGERANLFLKWMCWRLLWGQEPWVRNRGPALPAARTF